MMGDSIYTWNDPAGVGYMYDIRMTNRGAAKNNFGTRRFVGILTGLQYFYTFPFYPLYLTSLILSLIQRGEALSPVGVPRPTYS